MYKIRTLQLQLLLKVTSIDQPFFFRFCQQVFTLPIRSLGDAEFGSQSDQYFFEMKPAGPDSHPGAIHKIHQLADERRVFLGIT